MNIAIKLKLFLNLKKYFLLKLDIIKFTFFNMLKIFKKQ